MRPFRNRLQVLELAVCKALGMPPHRRGRRGARGSGGIDRRSILFDNSHSARGRPARGALRRRQEHHDLLQSALQ